MSVTVIKSCAVDTYFPSVTNTVSWYLSNVSRSNELATYTSPVDRTANFECISPSRIWYINVSGSSLSLSVKVNCTTTVPGNESSSTGKIITRVIYACFVRMLI